MSIIIIGNMEFENPAPDYAVSVNKRDFGTTKMPEHVAVKNPTNRAILLSQRNEYVSVEYVYTPAEPEIHPDKNDWYVYNFSESICRIKI